MSELNSFIKAQIILLFFLFPIGLITVEVHATSSCGPVPPGGKQDSKCQNQVPAPPIPYLQDAGKLRDLIKSEQIYFLAKSADSLALNGELFWYGDKSCFLVEEKTELSGELKVRTASCSDQIIKRSNIPYVNIGNFEDFKKKFIFCLQKKDVACLRSLTSKSVQVSFGVEPPGDQAYLLYSKWKKSDFEKMERLLRTGTNCNGDKCDFPKTVSDNGIGLRGGFEKLNGRWLLNYYLAGD